MRAKAIVIVIALVLAGVATVLAVDYINSARSEVAASSEPVEVLVAQEDIPRGLSAEELVAGGMILLEEVPQRYVAADAISSARAIEGQVLNTPLSKGEQVTTARFSLPSAAGLAYSVPADQVAIAIPVDEVRGISGMVRPGDRVAVFVTIEGADEEDEGGTITRLLLSEAKVVAMGAALTAETATQEAEGDGGGALVSSNTPNEAPSVMTLAVSPTDAEKLIFGEEVGSVWITLLPATAETPPEAPGRSLTTLFE
jgi:pilus assembly protein CpaB